MEVDFFLMHIWLRTITKETSCHDEVVVFLFCLFFVCVGFFWGVLGTVFVLFLFLMFSKKEGFICNMPEENPCIKNNVYLMHE